VTLSIADLAACAGHHHRLAARLAQLTGAWARDDRQASAALLFATHCPQFAWHADLWRARVPAQQAESTDERCRFDESLIHSVDTMAVASDTIERLVSIYQLVLPRLLTTCNGLRAAVDARIDGPTARVLDLMVRDLTVMVDDGAALLQRSR